jgi:hypothetical protein
MAPRTGVPKRDFVGYVKHWGKADCEKAHEAIAVTEPTSIRSPAQVIPLKKDAFLGHLIYGKKGIALLSCLLISRG